MAPVLHRYPLDEDEVRITLPPWQNIRGPLAVMVGISIGITITLVAAEVPAQVPEVVTL